MFKVLRPLGDTDELKYQPMRKSVVDLASRARVSLKINERAVNSLVNACTEEKFFSIINPFLAPIIKNDRRTRGLDPFEKDSSILKFIADGDYQINGFRNRDIRAKLFPEIKDKDEIKRCSAKVSRFFRILRKHGVIKKVPRTHRYLLADRGTRLVSALNALQESKVSDIIKVAA